ncbi:MAG: hypothetical protein WAK29_19325 [Terriglobales bacterium]
MENDFNSEAFKAGLKRSVRIISEQHNSHRIEYDFAAGIKSLSREIAGGVAALIGVLLVEYSAAAVVSELIDHPVKWSIVGLVIFYFVSICRRARPRS